MTTLIARIVGVAAVAVAVAAVDPEARYLLFPLTGP